MALSFNLFLSLLKCYLLLKAFPNKALENSLPSQSSWKHWFFSSTLQITSSSFIHICVFVIIRSMCWKTFLSWDMSLSCLHVQTTFSRTFVNPLEDRDSVSHRGKDQKSLLHIRKDSGSLSSGILSCNAVHWNCNCHLIPWILIPTGWLHVRKQWYTCNYENVAGRLILVCK